MNYIYCEHNCFTPMRNTCEVDEAMYGTLLRRLHSNIDVVTTGVTSGAGTAYPSGAPEFSPGF